MFGGKGIGGAKLAEIGVVCVLVLGTGYLGKQLHHNYVVHGGGASIEGLPTAPVILPGRTMDGSETDLALDDPETPKVLFVLSTTCPFCEDNMPEWRRLADSLEALGPEAPQPIVVSVSDAQATEEFLEHHRLQARVHLVDSAVLPLLGLSGYPSTVAIDPVTRGVAAWSGVLGDGEHSAIRAWARGQMASTSAAATTASAVGR